MVLTRQELPTIPAEARKLFRDGSWTQTTVGVCLGYVNANLAIVPQKMAFDFLLYCQRNPKPCPLQEVLEAGDPIVKTLADGADIRTDIARYKVFVRGELVDEPTDITKYWRDDLVTFLFGCSATFEQALVKAGIPAPWLEGDTCSPGVYVTNIPTVPAGRLQGPLVVSMRPIPASMVSTAVQVSARFARHHGSPVHIGDPEAIGIKDISKSDWLSGVEVGPGEVPVFWACGVTPQMVALESKPDLMITHYPGHMFLSDIPSEQHAVT